MKRHVVGKNDPHIVTFTYVFDEKVVSKTGGKKVAITAVNGINIPLSMENLIHMKEYTSEQSRI